MKAKRLVLHLRQGPSGSSFGGMLALPMDDGEQQVAAQCGHAAGSCSSAAASIPAASLAPAAAAATADVETPPAKQLNKKKVKALTNV